MKPMIAFWAAVVAALLFPAPAGATHFLGVHVVDQEYLMLHFRDGEVRYRDDGSPGTHPHQESFFNQRYLWVNGEFTPRETMRGKMALLAYLVAGLFF